MTAEQEERERARAGLWRARGAWRRGVSRGWLGGLVVAAATARVVAISGTQGSYDMVDAMMLHSPQALRGWLGEWGGPLGVPWLWFAVALLLAAGAGPTTAPAIVPLLGTEGRATWRVHALRAATVCAMAAMAIGQSVGPGFDITSLAAGAALLLATRRGGLPTWPVALGAWVLTARMGEPSRVFVCWREYDQRGCWPPPETLTELAPTWVLFQLAAALALWPTKNSGHAALRRLASVWALFLAVDAVAEAAVGFGLTQRNPWLGWMQTWSLLAQVAACGAALALARIAHLSLRGVLFRGDAHVGMVRGVAVATSFGLAMLAPTLARHPLPWDVRSTEFDALPDIASENSLTAPTLELAADFGPNMVLVAEPNGTVRNAQTGHVMATFPAGSYGLIMDRSATLADFAQVATRVLASPVGPNESTHVSWVRPRRLSEGVIGMIPARYTIRDVAPRQLAYSGVSAHHAEVWDCAAQGAGCTSPSGCR